jgi:hypothetical protein
MELWRKHYAYIPRRFMVIERIRVIMVVITPDPYDRLDPR